MTGWRALAWAVLGLPAAAMAVALATGREPATALLPVSGLWSLRLLVLALLAGPLAARWPRNRVLRAWLSLRRNIGVAAAAYGLLHLLFYALDMASLSSMLDELALPAIWTGWVALALLALAAAISFDAAVRALGRRWKRIQRGVYAALALALVHWALLDRAIAPALLYLAPLLVAWSLRAWTRRFRHERITA